MTAADVDGERGRGARGRTPDQDKRLVRTHFVLVKQALKSRGEG